MQALAGVDGCAGGWVCVLEEGTRLTGLVATSFAELLNRLPADAIVAIDIPIGLPDKGARICDLEARSFLRPPRARSVFAVPIRAALCGETYADACEAHFLADGRRM